MTEPTYIPPAHQPSHHHAGSPSSPPAFAITSLVLGILSIVGFFGLLTGIPAIIFGILALKKHSEGKGMAIAGIITGAIASLLSLLFIALIFGLIVLGITTDSRQDYRHDRPSSSYESSET